MARRYNENNVKLDSSRIDTELIKFRHKWIISDFSSMTAATAKKENFIGKRISSKNVDYGDEWQLSFFVGTNMTELNIALTLMRCLKATITAKSKIIIYGENNAEWTTISDIFCQEYKVGQRPINSPIDGSILYDPTTLFLPNDTLTIVCEIVIVANPASKVTQEKPNNEMIFHIPESELANDMEIFFNDQESGDFTFKFEDKELPAIKGILAARSSVFASMFKYKDLKENQSNYVDILDIKYEVFREMLLYIYTDKVPKLNEMAEDLLAVAEKYQLKRLKAMCEESLYKNISNDNALEILVLSDRYGSEQLRIRALEFISVHKKEILNTNAFRSLMTSDATQAIALILEVVDLTDFQTKSKK